VQPVQLQFVIRQDDCSGNYPVVELQGEEAPEVYLRRGSRTPVLLFDLTDPHRRDLHLFLYFRRPIKATAATAMHSRTCVPLYLQVFGFVGEVTPAPEAVFCSRLSEGFIMRYRRSKGMRNDATEYPRPDLAPETLCPQWITLGRPGAPAPQGPAVAVSMSGLKRRWQDDSGLHADEDGAEHSAPGATRRRNDVDLSSEATLLWNFMRETVASSTNAHVSTADTSAAALPRPFGAASSNSSNRDTILALATTPLLGLANEILAIARSAGPNTADGMGKTLLMYAAARGCLTGLKALLEWEGIDAAKQDGLGYTALLYAARSGHLDVLQALQAYSPALVSHKGDDNRTPFMIAAASGHTAVVEHLLADAGINEQDTKGHTAVWLAAQGGHLEVVDMLLTRGASLAASATPALFAACAVGSQAIVRRLVEAGASITLLSADWTSPLMVASEYGHLDVVRFLCNQVDSFHVNIANQAGGTALIYAASAGHLAVVRYLLGAGAAVNAQTKDGHSALTKAAQHGHTECVMELLRDGASATQVTATGHTALVLAALGDFDACVEVLVSANTDMAAFNSAHLTGKNEGIARIIRKFFTHNAHGAGVPAKRTEEFLPAVDDLSGAAGTDL
jgi:ankyrin repeat protein